MITVLLAVLKAGGAYLLLDPAFPDERLTALASGSGASEAPNTPDPVGAA